jgi:capsular polysaccharide biosynthesis protein
LLDNTRKASGKNEMSIDSLINPPSALSKKRKADELEEAVADAAAQDTAAATATAPVTEPSQAEPIVDATAAVTQALQDALPSESDSSVSPQPVVIAEKLAVPASTYTSEPPQKRLRTAAAFAAGVLVGGVGMLAGLVSIPDGYLA